MQPEQESDIANRVQRLRSYINEHTPGSCTWFSSARTGVKCECPRCQIDDLVAACLNPDPTVDEQDTETCRHCHKHYYPMVWATADETWEAVTGISDGSGLFCPHCFSVMAGEKGVSLYWVATQGDWPEAFAGIGRVPNAATPNGIQPIDWPTDPGWWWMEAADCAVRPIHFDGEIVFWNGIYIRKEERPGVRYLRVDVPTFPPREKD